MAGMWRSRSPSRYDRVMKLYTRTGDDGTTGLLGGGRVGKDSLRIHAIGDVDELNSVLGLCAAACGHPDIAPLLTRMQNRLFDCGADLATVDGPGAAAEVRITEDDVAWAEQAIDAMCRDVPPITQFILPGGTELAARLHLARAVCRRAERTVTTLAQREAIAPALLIYLNRLSDLLFAMARRANHQAGTPDVVWKG